jgi:outer membrane protein OmpA-like peptidoglycan-associated protein
LNRIAGLAAALMLGGCATSSAVLLPGEHGAPVGALAVLNADGSDAAVLNEANSAAALRSRPTVHRLDGSDVPRKYRALVDGLPERPASFTLYFYEGSTRIVPDSESELQRMFAEVARRGAGVDVEVVGHTDTLDDESTNDRLSRARASEILDLLVERGLDRNTSRAVGRGERDLAVQTADNVREPRNRRVEVVVR